MIVIDTIAGIDKLAIPATDQNQLQNWLNVQIEFAAVYRNLKEMVADLNGEIGLRRERHVLKKQSADKHANTLGDYSKAVDRLFKAYDVLEKYLDDSDEWVKTDRSQLSSTGKLISFQRGNVRVSFNDAQAEITIYETDEQ